MERKRPEFLYENKFLVIWVHSIMLLSQNWIRAIMAPPHVTTSFQSPCRIGLTSELLGYLTFHLYILNSIWHGHKNVFATEGIESPWKIQTCKWGINEFKLTFIFWPYSTWALEWCCYMGWPLWPGFSFDLIALWNGLKWPEICFHIKIQVFSFPYTPKKVL